MVGAPALRKPLKVFGPSHFEIVCSPFHNPGRVTGPLQRGSLVSNLYTGNERRLKCLTQHSEAEHLWRESLPDDAAVNRLHHAPIRPYALERISRRYCQQTADRVARQLGE